ncbi:NTP transferase domain-containing protein [bacterium]|nr:NTP transferase domain-containing protein [bacterium]NCQ54851.1 NTP transferase domain-containing protein [Candidatus Parcubacteria bacterium]NCS66895.1 NTP transferase domain-containing protein [Candidatus Peregrinibacteria bacterium]NCS95841.1 NTP transferase domain-containing protein [bacterium]
MKTIFLAAGSSSRMEPISDKNFLEFLGKPLMLHLLENAAKAGCTNFIIVTNPDNLKAVKELCKNHDFLSPAQVTIQPRLEEGMAGGILAGLEFLEDDESVLIYNGNDFVEADIIKKIIKEASLNDGALLGQRRATYFPGGYLEINPQGKIQSIIEKPGEGKEPSNLVNIVVHAFAKAGDLKKALSNARSESDDVYEVALDALFKTHNFKAVEYNGVWQAIKYPWHVLEMMDVLLATSESYTSSKADIAPSATIKGKHVIIEEGVRIFENAVISGPAYIGKNAVVGNNALVRNSIIGENSVIGYNTEVARSWLGKDITSHMAYIGDSVIADNVNFGAYSCTANLRLDKKTVRVKIKEDLIDSNHTKLGAIVGFGTQIGIGAKLMPGCKTPVQTLIRPGEIWT